MTKFTSTTNCFVFDKNQVLMLHRSKSIYKFPDFWMGPGGRQEPYEDVLAACVREVKEETGLDVDKVKLRIIATHYYPHKDEVYIVFIFTADYIGGELRKEEMGDLEWIERDKVLELEKLYPDLRIHLPLIFQDSSELFFTHMEFDDSSQVVNHRITPISEFNH